MHKKKDLHWLNSCFGFLGKLHNLLVEPQEEVREKPESESNLQYKTWKNVCDIVVYFSGYIFLTYAYNMMTGLKMRGPHFLSLGLPSC